MGVQNLSHCCALLGCSYKWQEVWHTVAVAPRSSTGTGPSVAGVGCGWGSRVAGRGVSGGVNAGGHTSMGAAPSRCIGATQGHFSELPNMATEGSSLLQEGAGLPCTPAVSGCSDLAPARRGKLEEGCNCHQILFLPPWHPQFLPQNALLPVAYLRRGKGGKRPGCWAGGR